MSIYKSFNDVPLMLNAEDIKVIMNISRAGAYQLMHREDFPTIMVGKRLLVPRDEFLRWMNQHTRVASDER